MLRSLKVMLAATGLLLLSIGYTYAINETLVFKDSVTLNLGNTNCGFLISVEGGGIGAEVMNEPSDPSSITKKHIGLPIYKEFSMQIGFNMTKDIYKWISDFWAMNGTRKDGSITTCDYQYKSQSVKEFNQAIITETTIPACGSNLEEPAYITVKFAPERTTYKQGDGSSLPSQFNTKQKIWQTGDFRLSIDGLDCTKIEKIDSFTVKRSAVIDDIGNTHKQNKEPGKVEFPNLVITLHESTAQSWIDWHKSFVIDGNNGDLQEKSGTLAFIIPGNDKPTELAHIKFHNLGICSLDPEKLATKDASATKLVKITLYCEDMDFIVPDDTVSGGSDQAGSSNTTSTPAQTTAQKPSDDCQLGVNYAIGASSPINLTVNSIEYTAERKRVGKEYRRPDADQKMVVVHYTLQNPGSTNIPVGTTSIDWKLTDLDGVNYQRDRYAGVEGSGEVVNSTLSSGQSINCFACFQMPAKGPVARLTAAAHGDTNNQAVYKLEGKTTPLPKLYADPQDQTGSTRRKVVEGKIGQAYQVMDYDIKVDGIEYTSQPISNWALRKGQQFMLMTVEYTNFTGTGYAVAGNNIEIIDQNGQPYTRTGVLAANELTVITPKPDPEATAKFRLAFIVPKDFKPQCINLKNALRPMVRIDMQGIAPVLGVPRRAG